MLVKPVNVSLLFLSFSKNTLIEESMPGIFIDKLFLLLVVETKFIKKFSFNSNPFNLIILSEFIFFISNLEFSILKKSLVLSEKINLLSSKSNFFLFFLKCLLMC